MLLAAEALRGAVPRYSRGRRASKRPPYLLQLVLYGAQLVRGLQLRSARALRVRTVPPRVLRQGRLTAHIHRVCAWRPGRASCEKLTGHAHA